MQPQVCVRRGIPAGTRALATVLVWTCVIASAQAQSVPAPRNVVPTAHPEPWTPCSTGEDPSPNTHGSETAPGLARIALNGDSISLEVRGCTLKQTLALAAARTGIRIIVSDAMPQVPLSVQIPRQPIDAAIRELLRDMDVFVLYAAKPKGTQRLAAVWAYPAGSTRGVEPVPADVWASTRDMQRQLGEWNPDLRARAIEALVARVGDAALPDVLAALADGDASIRQRALDAALTAGLDVPLQQLHALTLTDDSPEVRLRALQTLEERPDSASIIEAATQDADANVRREAQSILVRVNRTPP